MQKAKCEKLERACRNEEQAHWKRVAALIERNRAADDHVFHEFKNLSSFVSSAPYGPETFCGGKNPSPQSKTSTAA